MPRWTSGAASEAWGLRPPRRHLAKRRAQALIFGAFGGTTSTLLRGSADASLLPQPTAHRRSRMAAANHMESASVQRGREPNGGKRAKHRHGAHAR